MRIIQNQILCIDKVCFLLLKSYICVFKVSKQALTFKADRRLFDWAIETYPLKTF